MCLCALQAQDYFLWCSQLIGAMAAEESISDVSTADLQLAHHQQLWAEMEARQETYQQAVDMGEELQKQDKAHRKEVRRSECDLYYSVYCYAPVRCCLTVFPRGSCRCWRSWTRCRQSERNWRSSGTQNNSG